MLVASEQVLHQRIDVARIALQYSRPIETRKLIRKLLRALPIINPQENIVVLDEGYPVGRKLSLQPIMPVHINLNLHGKPGLQLYMDQTEFLIHEIEVNKQAFPSGGLYERSPFYKPERKCPAWFQY